MPSVDFYYISPEKPEAALLFACRLLEKAYLQEHQIYVHLENAAKAQFLDNLLWTFKDESFIPHQVLRSESELSAPIQLGHSQQLPPHADILLNLHPDIPPFHSDFKRILEIVPNLAEAKAKAELHRAFYAEKGYKISSHTLTV